MIEVQLFSFLISDVAKAWLNGLIIWVPIVCSVIRYDHLERTYLDFLISFLLKPFLEFHLSFHQLVIEFVKIDDRIFKVLCSILQAILRVNFILLYYHRQPKLASLQTAVENLNAL